MKLKAVNLAPGAFFMPELNDNGPHWIVKSPLTEQSPFLEVDDRIASRLVGAYPENFEIVDGSSKKNMSEEATRQQTFSESPQDSEKSESSSKADLKNKMAEKYSKNASVEN